MTDLVCKECGALDYQTNYLAGREKQVMDECGVCFSCAFWTLRVRHQTPKTVIAGGTVYQMGQETNKPSHWRGFGGQAFEVEFLDGRRVTTTNLWCNGAIPAHFKDRLPDNASLSEARRPTQTHAERSDDGAST